MPPGLDEPAGPLQRGRGVPGQYMYWATQSHPSEENAQQLRLPTEFTRESFCEFIVKAHNEYFTEKAINNSVVEAAVFKELHANGLVHMNALIRARMQFRWKLVADWIRTKHKVFLNYGTNVKSWSEGAVYGCVGSEHKPPEALDQTPYQWIQSGTPAICHAARHRGVWGGA